MELQNKRILKILKTCIASKRPLTGQHLADLIGVSSRTIRSDMKELNGFLRDKGAHILAETGSGYTFVIDDAAKYERLKDAYSLGSSTAYKGVNIVPSDSNDRINFVIARILLNSLHKKVVNQEELADELFISLSTLKKYLADIKKSLARFGLELSADRLNGIKITGDEANIRYCISEYIFNHNDLVNLSQQQFVGDLFPQEEIDAVKCILLKGILKHNIHLTDIAFKNLLVHIVITLRRAGAENTVEYTENERNKMQKSLYFAAAGEILEMVRRQLGVDLENEVYYLTQHFIASQKFIESDKSRDDCQPLIQEILRKIKINTDIDLSGDTELVSGLTIHLIAALSRLKFNMNIRNEILASIKKNYPSAFEMAIIASEVMEQEENVKINENEIGFLAIHFGAALERYKCSLEMGKTAIIVCGTGLSTALLLKSRLQRRFGSILQIKGVTGCYEITPEIVDSVDFVFTTVPISHIRSGKIIRVEPIMTEDDLVGVERKINRMSAGKTEVRYETFFKHDLFFPRLKGSCAVEVIEKMSDEMVRKGYINEKIKQSVLDREKMASTEIGGLVAMPHALENEMQEAAIAVGILEHPILWRREQVQLVFLLSIPKHLYGVWEPVFKTIYKNFIDGRGAHRLSQNLNFDVLLELLTNPAE